jgi:hypothetical protein
MNMTASTAKVIPLLAMGGFEPHQVDHERHEDKAPRANCHFERRRGISRKLPGHLCLTSVFEAPIMRSLASLRTTQRELQPHQINQELAPKIEHPAPGIFYVARCRLFENALVNVMRDLIA